MQKKAMAAGKGQRWTPGDCVNSFCILKNEQEGVLTILEIVTHLKPASTLFIATV